MRSRCGGGCCWRSKRPSARADADKQRRLLTFVIVGAGPTGVELAGALAEIARQSLRQDFRRIHPESARIVLLEGGPYRAARRFRSRCAPPRGGRSSALASRCAPGRSSPASTMDGVADRSANAISAETVLLGGRRRGVAARELARRPARSRRTRDAGADARLGRALRTSS